MYRSMSILPQYEPSQAFNGMGEYFTPNGIGEYFTPNAIGQFQQAAAGVTGLRTLCPNGCGIGQFDGNNAAAGVAAAVVGLGVLGLWIYMGYHIGKDLSPSGRNWGTGGAFMSLLGPFAHWGYGIMALSNGR